MGDTEYEFAPDDLVEEHWPTICRIVTEVLDYDMAEVILSDESQLYDFVSFGSKEGIGEFLNRIYAVFGVDASVIEDSNIVAIAKLIEEQGKA